MPKNKKRISPIAEKFKSWMLPKRVRNFKDEESGATAVEFAMLAGPFFLLFMAIIECSLLFFAGQLLESSVDAVGRKIRVGIISSDATKLKLQDEICAEAKVLFECNKLFIDLQVVATYADLGDTPEPVDGEMDENQFNIDIPGPLNIVMLTAAYEWPVFTNYMAKHLSTLKNDNALLMGVSVFRTEPYN